MFEGKKDSLFRCGLTRALSVAFIIGMLSGVHAGVTSDGFIYEFGESNTVRLIGYSGAGGNLLLPEEIEGMLVAEVAARAFSYQAGITAVAIPGTITEIPFEAFFACSNLTQLILHEGVCELAGSAFFGCPALEQLTVPASLFPVGVGIFDATNLTATLANGTTSVRAGLFDGMKGLASVSLPTSIESIGDDAFRRTGLTGIDLPYSLSEIGARSFARTPLASIALPSAMTFLGPAAFKKCHLLTNVVFPDSLSVIGEDAFAGCVNLESASLPDSLTSIGSGAFRDAGLSTVSLPTGLLSIGAWSFAGTSLADLVIPTSLVEVGEFAFRQTLLADVTLPATLRLLGRGAFENCVELTNVYVSSSNENYADVDGVLFNKALTQLICYPGGRTAERYTVPGGVNSIAARAFASARTNGLSALTLPGSLSVISESAFFGMASLETMSFPAALSTIEPWAFNHSPRLASFYFLDDAPAVQSRSRKGAFYGLAAGATAFVPSGTNGFTFPEWNGLLVEQMGEGAASSNLISFIFST